jgi:hypothetical protein
LQFIKVEGCQTTEGTEKQNITNGPRSTLFDYKFDSKLQNLKLIQNRPVMKNEILNCMLILGSKSTVF